MARLLAPQPLRTIYAFTSSALAIAMIAACARAAPAARQTHAQFFPYVVAMRGCTQEDAPALEIYLTRTPFDGKGEPPQPYVRVEISSSATETIAPGIFKLSSLRRDPAATGRVVRAELVEPGHDPIWLTGAIVLREAAPGRRATGRFEVTTPAAKSLLGGFTGEYRNRISVCG